MDLLLTNDDGWNAPGLQSLIEVAGKFGNVWVVAPRSQQSGVSHQMTFEQLMKFEKQGERSYSLDGTPADCVRIGLSQLDMKFDWVLSGVNDGGNLGTDVYISGTVAAAREAAFSNIPAIAISQHRRNYGQAFDWTASKFLTERVLSFALNQTRMPRMFSNFNLPDLPLDDAKKAKMTECELEPSPLPLDYKKTDEGFTYCGTYNGRGVSTGSDVESCFRGEITMTRFRV